MKNNSSIKKYLETPSEALAENDRNIAKAISQAESDPLVNIMQQIGNGMMQYGAKGMSSNNSSDFAYGGETYGSIEAEGDEVVDTGEETFELKGPKHSKGGIDLLLPNGSIIYSNRIKVGDKSLAERKKERELKLNKSKRILDKDNKDALNKNTFERQSEILKKQEKSDLNIQNLISVNKNKNKAAFGATVEADDSFTKNLLSNLENINVGDIVSSYGNYFSATAPYKNTLKNKAGDTPNINAFENFGENALETLSQTENFIQSKEKDAQLDIDRNARTSRQRARNSARSIQTKRALDLGIHQKAQQAKSDVALGTMQNLMKLLSNKAQLQNQQDQVVMSGEQQRDLADRQDRDNFFTNLSQNLTGIGEGLQVTGKEINQQKEDDLMLNLINQMSQFIDIDSSGNIQNKQ